MACGSFNSGRPGVVRQALGKVLLPGSSMSHARMAEEPQDCPRYHPLKPTIPPRCWRERMRTWSAWPRLRSGSHGECSWRHQVTRTGPQQRLRTVNAGEVPLHRLRFKASATGPQGRPPRRARKESHGGSSAQQKFPRSGGLCACSNTFCADSGPA